MTCTLSQMGLFYFTSECSNTEIHDEKCLTHFEDYWGDVTCKEINQPSICHNLCKFLPLEDEYDRGRQSILGLERK